MPELIKVALKAHCKAAKKNKKRAVFNPQKVELCLLGSLMSAWVTDVFTLLSKCDLIIF